MIKWNVLIETTSKALLPLKLRRKHGIENIYSVFQEAKDIKVNRKTGVSDMARASILSRELVETFPISR